MNLGVMLFVFVSFTVCLTVIVELCNHENFHKSIVKKFDCSNILEEIRKKLIDDAVSRKMLFTRTVHLNSKIT